MLPVLLGQVVERLTAALRARDIVVVDELHVAAKRDPRDPPAGAVAVIEADDLGAEADREHFDGDAAPARDDKMAEFVEKYDDGEDEEEGEQIREKGVAEPRKLADD